MIFKKCTGQCVVIVSLIPQNKTFCLAHIFYTVSALFFPLYNWFHYQLITFNSYEIQCDSLAEVKALTFSLFSLSSPPSCMDLNLLISSLHLSLHAIPPFLFNLPHPIHVCNTSPPQ